MNSSTNQLVEHFFRHEWANLIAVLTRAFGMSRMELVEDMVQVAMLEAMDAWKHSGIPENPAAWIHRVAKNRVLDALRRQRVHDRAVAFSAQTLDDRAEMVDGWLDDERLPDSLLRMMFVCCHPTLERKTQIALTLKTLCGFGVSEIARGLLLPPETVKKRIQRARQTLAAQNVQPELPEHSQLGQRVEIVHEVLYLMFNEGYSASRGPEPVRDDICEESARLCHLLCGSPYATPATKALLALFLFHSARLEARTDGAGGVILLEDQDRSRWNWELIAAGKCWLAQSKGDHPTTYHLEAAIALQHCVATTVDNTDWETIVRLYDRLRQLRDSPLYALNQAIAIGQAGDTARAHDQLASLRACDDLENYLLLDCAIARMFELEGNSADAIECYLAALAKATAEYEKQFLKRKLAELTA